MGAAYRAYWCTQWASRLLPAAVSDRLAVQLADGQARREGAARRAVAANLSLATAAPVVPQSDLVREVFRSFGRYLTEFFSMDQHHPHVTIEGEDHLKAARQAKGGIFLTAHLGNWELGGVVLQRLGYPLTGIALPHADPRTNRLFLAQRQRSGLTTLTLGPQAWSEARRALQAGRWLGLVGDRDFSGHRVAVAWNGRRIYLPSGPALLSLQAQVPLLPVFLVREGRWRFRLVVGAPLVPPAVRRSLEHVAALTQRYADVLRGCVRRYAGQWALFQPLPEVL